jgi:cytochrome c oxidase assembly protein subunit 15
MIDGQTPNSPHGRVWLHRFVLLTTGFTFLLIIAGALVTGNEAGLAVPDWPLSYGALMPPMVGNIRYEHGHRMVATFVGFLTTVLAVWLWRRESRRRVRKWGFIALGTVIAQGVLGGLTVLFFLPTAISVSHACLAQAFFCIMVSLSLMTSPSWEDSADKRVPENRSAPLRWLSAVTASAIYFQLILGAALRHAKSGIVLHVLGALVVTVLVLVLVTRIFKQYAKYRVFVRLGSTLSLLLVGQLSLGVGSYLVRLAARDDIQPATVMVTITTAHVAVGALVLATSLILAIQSHRLLSPSLNIMPLSSAPQKVAP